MAFTYDVTTARGQVRLLIRDTDTETAANQVYTDAEIDAFLGLEASDPLMAAALALDSTAADAAKSAVMFSLISGAMNVDKRGLSAALGARAEVYRKRARARPHSRIDHFDYHLQPWDGVDVSEWDEGLDDDEDALHRDSYRTGA